MNKMRKSKFILYVITFLVLLFVYLIYMVCICDRFIYKEKSNVKYIIYLKENNYYSKNSDENYISVKKPINKIRIKYNYTFNINKKSNISFKYKVLARLIVKKQATSKKIYEKTIDLTKNKELIKNNIKSYNINKNVDIDYLYYNELIEKIKLNYRDDTLSYINVYLIVSINDDNKISNSSKALVSIPLNDRKVITIRNQSINNIN